MRLLIVYFEIKERFSKHCYYYSSKQAYTLKENNYIYNTLYDRPLRLRLHLLPRQTQQAKSLTCVAIKAYGVHPLSPKLYRM